MAKLDSSSFLVTFFFSVRAWRGLRFNEKYAAKLEQKRIRENANRLAKEKADRQKKVPMSNPFSVSFFLLIFISRSFHLREHVSFQIGNRAADNADPHIFDMSAQIFGHISTAPVPESDGRTSVEITEDDGSEKDADSDSASSEKSLLTALASVTIAESPWRCAPSYPTLYLSTMGEYLPPHAKPKVPKGIQVSELGDEETKDKDVSWATETYENSLEMDHVFERFTKRVGHEGKQCVRSAMNLSYSMTKLIILIDMNCGVHRCHLLRTRRLIYCGQCHAKSRCP
jgi:pre-rRNA-processing protein TSR4